MSKEVDCYHFDIHLVLSDQHVSVYIPVLDFYDKHNCDFFDVKQLNNKIYTMKKCPYKNIYCQKDPIRKIKLINCVLKNKNDTKRIIFCHNNKRTVDNYLYYVARSV